MYSERHSLKLSSAIGDLEIVGEPLYSLRSVDNPRVYPMEFDLRDGLKTGFAYGILRGGIPLAAIAVPQWGLPLGEKSAIIWHERLYLLAANQIACFSLNPFVLVRSVDVDTACCFGLHLAPTRDMLICHGEMDITRLSEDVEIIWQRGGRDILTGGFTLRPDYIEVSDFNDDLYRFDYDTGSPLAAPLP
jgi:hypothetical protein